MSVDFILKIRDDHWRGYRLEVDLRCPVEFHNKFKEFPPARETLTPYIAWLTLYQRDIEANTGIIHNGLIHGTNKFVPHLYDHKNHIMHYNNLKYLVGPGVQVTKKHKVVSFSQRLWLKPYSDFNTQNRAQANHEVEKTIC